MGFPVSLKQDMLLTLDTKKLPIYKDVLPGVKGVDVQPLMLDPEQGVWVVKAIMHPGVIFPKHYHTGSVHLFTLSGKWYYAEYKNQPQEAGSYLFEPGGSIHQLIVPETNTEPTEFFAVISGANVNFDQDENYVGLLDASSILALIDMLVRERGLDPAKYIRPQEAKLTL